MAAIPTSAIDVISTARARIMSSRKLRMGAASPTS